MNPFRIRNAQPNVLCSSLRLAYSLMLCASLAMMLSACSRQAGNTSCITLQSQLAELTNVESFANSPLGQSKMASSYDRTGANNDWIVLSEKDASGYSTLAQLEGPGCVSRLWMTSVPAD